MVAASKRVGRARWQLIQSMPKSSSSETDAIPEPVGPVFAYNKAIKSITKLTESLTKRITKLDTAEAVIGGENPPAPVTP